MSTPDPNPADQDDQPADFDERDEVVLRALGLGWTYAEAAALIGRDPKWVQRRMRSDKFRFEVRHRRSAQLDAIAGQLGAIGPRAVSVIHEAMDDDDPSIRLRAATAALNSITKLGRQADIEQRLSELEAKSIEAEPRRTGGKSS